MYAPALVSVRYVAYRLPFCGAGRLRWLLAPRCSIIRVLLLISAAVFCFRRYSAVRVLCGRFPWARVQFPYKGTKNFSNMQILNDPLFETSEKNRIFGYFLLFFLQLTIRPLQRFFIIYLLFSFFCRNFASFFVPFHRAIIERISREYRENNETQLLVIVDNCWLTFSFGHQFPSINLNSVAHGVRNDYRSNRD